MILKNINKKKIFDIIPKRSFHNLRSQKILNFKNSSLKYERLAKRKASNLSITFDKVANSIPKSSIILVGLCAGVGIAALAAYGASTETKMDTYTATTNMYGTTTPSDVGVVGNYSKELRQKMGMAYGYFAGSLGLTAISAVILSKSPLAYRLHQHRWAAIAIGVGGSLAAMIGTYSLSYHHNYVAKHLSWLALVGIEGFTLAPLTMLGGPLIMNAVIGTTCIVGSISLLTAVSPSDSWRQWSGIYGIALGSLLGVSIGLIFFPRSQLLYNLMLYGGLAIHGWGVNRSTGRIIDHANHVPISVYDPINESISLYIHTMAIFIRMVMMLQNNRKN